MAESKSETGWIQRRKSNSNRRKLLFNIQTEHSNFSYKPWAMPILKVSSFFIRSFKTTVSFESQVPTDGSLVFSINHQNFYDSLVVGFALDRVSCFTCLAGDEPRGKLQGLSFEARGVVWINRADPDSRKASTETLLALLKAGLSIGWSPEGTWNTTENRLMLPIARGMARLAIEAARTTKVYIVPVCMDYQYKENSYKVKRASVRVCKAIQVSPEMQADKLTEEVETVCWTTRWLQMEERMKRTPGCIVQGSDYIYPRASIPVGFWNWFVDKLHGQYKVDWTAEASYRIITPEERLQNEMQKYINPGAIQMTVGGKEYFR